MLADIFLADAMTKKILFWIGVCIVSLLVMVRPAAANTYTIVLSNGQLCDSAATLTSTFATPQLAMDAFVASWPRNCMVGGVLHYQQTASGFVLTSNTSLTYNIAAIAANQYTGGSAAVTGVVKTWTENVVACPAAGGLHSSGYFNIGTSPNGQALASACQDGCAIKTIGSTSPPGQSLYLNAYPRFRQIRNGVWYYFADMSYYHTGESCSPDTANFLSDFVGSLPNMSCGAGQQMVTMSGVTKCFNSDGTATNANSASAVAAAKTLADAQAASRVAAAGTLATQSGLSASGVADAKSIAAGVAAAGLTGGTSSNPYSTSDPMFQYCVDNPDADLCQQKTACDKNPNLASCAELGTVADDVPLGIRTVTVSSITPVSVGGAGACPAPRAMVLHGQTYYMAFDTYCNFATGIKPIILVFAWLASAGLLVGGFKAS